MIGRFPTHKISHPKRVEKSQQETTWAIEDSKVEKFEGQNIEIKFFYWTSEIVDMFFLPEDKVLVVGILLDSSVLLCYKALGTFGRSGANLETGGKKAGAMPRKIRLADLRVQTGNVKSLSDMDKQVRYY